MAGWKTNSAMKEGIALNHCAVVLTRYRTLVPTRNSQVYATHSSYQRDLRQQVMRK